MDETDLTADDLERFYEEGEPATVENLATSGVVLWRRLDWSGGVFRDNRSAKPLEPKASDLVTRVQGRIQP